MGSSMLSSMSIASSHGKEDQFYSSGEESTWTDYIAHFEAAESGRAAAGGGAPLDGRVSAATAFGGGYYVSDSASVGIPAGNAKPSRASAGAAAGLPEGCRRCKVRRRRASLKDDSLEDTASSPVSSPKIGGTDTAFLVNPKGKDDPRTRYLAASSEDHAEAAMDFVGRMNAREELKKRGLCLVSTSVLINHLR